MIPLVNVNFISMFRPTTFYLLRFYHIPSQKILYYYFLKRWTKKVKISVLVCSCFCFSSRFSEAKALGESINEARRKIGKQLVFCQSLLADELVKMCLHMALKLGFSRDPAKETTLSPFPGSLPSPSTHQEKQSVI